MNRRVCLVFLPPFSISGTVKNCLKKTTSAYFYLSLVLSRPNITSRVRVLAQLQKPYQINPCLFIQQCFPLYLFLNQLQVGIHGLFSLLKALLHSLSMPVSSWHFILMFGFLFLLSFFSVLF